MGVRSPDAPRTSRPPRLSAGARASTASRISHDGERPPRPDRDMRSKRPPALSFLLRMDTMRRALRVVSLLTLDLLGVSLAIFTALALKAALLASFDVTSAFNGTRSILAFAYLLTALLFARSGLYAERSQRPGLSRIVGSLFQVAFVALIFAVVSGEHFSSFYIFYGSLAFALFYISSLRYLYERATGAVLRAAGLSAPCGAGGHRQAHPRRRQRTQRRTALADRSRRLRVAQGRCLPTGCAAGRARAPAGCDRRRARRRGDHRRPRFPAGSSG